MGIPGKRLQQGIYEAAASVNRAAGSGGGSGFQVFSGASPSVHGGNAVGNPGLAYSVAAYTLVQDGSGVTCSITTTVGPATGTYFLFGDVVVQGPTAVPDQLALFQIFLDGSAPSDSPLLASGSTNTSNTFTTTVPILYACVLHPGVHTLDVRINNSSSHHMVFSFDLYCFRMGG
jgi:hypothetical protein